MTEILASTRFGGGLVLRAERRDGPARDRARRSPALTALPSALSGATGATRGGHCSADGAELSSSGVPVPARRQVLSR